MQKLKNILMCMLTLTIPIQAVEMSSPQDDCCSSCFGQPCQTSCCWSNQQTLLTMGTLLLSAATGAGAGYAAGRGKSSHCSKSGNQSNLCLSQTTSEEMLTFDIELQYDIINSTTPPDVNFMLITPQGCTMVPDTPTEANLSAYPKGKIFVRAPALGTFFVGAELEADIDAQIVILNLTVAVTSALTGVTTSFQMNPTPELALATRIKIPIMIQFVYYPGFPILPG